MRINEWLARAREYIYDRDDWQVFRDEILTADKATQQAVAQYMAGHGVVIARHVPPRGKPGTWVWWDKTYIPALVPLFKANKGHYEALGWGKIETPDRLEAILLGKG